MHTTTGILGTCKDTPTIGSDGGDGRRFWDVGLEIMHRLEADGCGLLRLKEGTLYPALYRLEAAGKISVVREERPETGRGACRRIYRLSRKGKRQLIKGREEWANFVQIIGSIVGAPA